jgi:hypothetical protein
MGFSMSWSHRYKPASGMPAMGPGWGGEARGAGRGGPAKPFQPGNTTRVPFHKGLADPTKGEHRRARTAEKAARIEELTELLCDLAFNSDCEGTQLNATIAALNRLEGYPVAKTEHQNSGLSFDELVRTTQAPKSAS